MKNRDIATLFDDVSKLLEIRGDNIHRVLSYRRAAENIVELGRELADIRAAGTLTDIPGIGATLAEKIEEILDTGKLEFYERLTADVPASLLELLRVDGVGPKRVKQMYEQLGITNLAALEEAAKAGKLRELPKMGKKSEENIIRGLELLKAHGDDRTPLGVAWPLAQRILADLRAVGGVTETAVGGSLRRMRDTIGDIDLLVAADDPQPVMDAFRSHPLAEEVTLKGETKSRIRLENGLGVDLRVVEAKHWGTLLAYFTGSQAHNVRMRELAQKNGLSLNEYAFTHAETDEKIFCPTEEDVYKTLNLPYVIPQLREDRGEFEAAKKGALPAVIQPDDIVSDLHMHTTWSDGKFSILEMAQHAQSLGYTHICITDHSYSLGIANGLSAERLAEQAEAIAAANAEMGEEFTILHGSEMEIRADGSLDFPDDVLERLDFVIASLHTSLRQPRKEVTKRMLNAIENRHVDMLAHPSGRLLPDRPGADLDFEAIFAAAAEKGTILEINANWRRLDLRDSHVQRALELGIKIAINCDAHHTDQFGMLHYGVATAQRGWATAADVINTWPLDKLRAYLDNKVLQG